MPYLAAWDSTLRLISATASIRRRFKPGFVLDDELLGLTTGGGGAKIAVVYLHPDRFAQVVKAHKHRPLAIAAFLHGIACHELTHLDGRMGEGHNESFVSAREDLGNSTGHLLPAIAILVVNLLGLQQPPTAEQKKIAALERRLAKGEDVKRELAKVRREAKASRTELDAALAESSRLRAMIDSGGGCGTCRCSERARLADVLAAIRGNLPEGMEAADLDGFVQRKETMLLDLLATRGKGKGKGATGKPLIMPSRETIEAKYEAIRLELDWFVGEAGWSPDYAQELLDAWIGGYRYGAGSGEYARLLAKLRDDALVGNDDFGEPIEPGRLRTKVVAMFDRLAQYRYPAGPPGGISHPAPEVAPPPTAAR